MFVCSQLQHRPIPTAQFLSRVSIRSMLTRDIDIANLTTLVRILVIVVEHVTENGAYRRLLQIYIIDGT